MTRTPFASPRPAERPWRGLPHGRVLDARDLSWFLRRHSTFSFWQARRGPVDADAYARLAEAMRRTYDACTAGAWK